MSTSPTKRRALASLDANASAPSPRGLKTGKPTTALPSPAIARVSLSTGQLHEQKKRPSISALEEPPAKKPCLEPPKEAMDENDSSFQSERQRSASPADSSVFDNSTIDTSQATALTEPDQQPAIQAPTVSVVAPVAPAPPPPRPLATREESRRRVDTLRLRLRLADYKIRTNQTDVPFDQLHARPLPGVLPAHVQAQQPQRRTPLPSAPSRGLTAIQMALQSQRLLLPRPISANAGFTQPRQSFEQRHPNYRQQQDEEDDSEDEEMASHSNSQESAGSSARAGANRAFLSPQKLPQLAGRSAALTPRRPHLDEEAEENLTSSALRGGAAKGLLRLSLGRM